MLFKRKIKMMSGIFLEGLKICFSFNLFLYILVLWRWVPLMRLYEMTKYMKWKIYLGYILGCPIITYRLIVIANTVNNDTAKRPYLRNGNKRHNNSPWVQALFQNVLAAIGILKQQNNKSANERFIIKHAVALRTWKLIKINVG